MEITNIPDFEELVFDLDEAVQEKEPGQEKTEEIVIEEESKDNSKDESSTYSDNADPLAIQTYQHLKEKNIIFEDESTKFDGTWETLEEQLESIPERVLNTMIQQAPELGKQLIKFAFSSENITLEDFKEFTKAYIEENSQPSTEIDNMDEAREYLENVYKSRGMRPSAVRAALDALEEDELLIEEAKLELEKDAKTKTKATDEIIAKKQNEDAQRYQDQQKFVQSISTELNETGWQKERVERVKKVMSGGNISTILTEISKSPKAFIKLADFLDYYNKDTKDIDYSKFMTKAETKEALSFKDKVDKVVNTPNSNTKSTLTNPNSDWDDLEPVF